MTRVAILVKEFPPNVIGGTETQTEKMARSLIRRGHGVTVYTKSYPDEPDIDTEYDLVRVPTRHHSEVISTATFALFAFLYLVRDARKYDILQCMMVYPTGFIGWLVNRITGLPYFAWIRGGDYYFMKDHPLKRWTIRKVLSDTLVLVQTRRVRSDVHREFPNANLEVIGNGVPLPETRAYGDNLVYVGRLKDQKGVDVLLQAVNRLDHSERLLVVGDGPERDRLQSLAEELQVDAEFVGEVPPEQVVTYLRKGKLLVLPSVRGEGLPNAVLEAMAVGLPVVATDTGGVADAIADGETGYVVEPGDPDALAENIQRLCSSDEWLESFGENAREYVEANHSWEVIVGELESVYEHLQ